jgi:hypothetical protein
MEQLINKLPNTIVILLEEYYYSDGIGQDYFVLYPLNTEIPYDQTAKFIEQLNSSYYLLLEYHIKESTILMIYQRN